MTADSQYEIKNINWYPCFKDPKIEQEFMVEFSSEALKSGRIALWIMTFVWVGFAWVELYHLGGHEKLNALFFRLLVVTPLFLMILAALYSKYATRIYQTLVIFALIIIEGGLYYISKFYPVLDVARSIGYELPVTEADGTSIFIAVWFLVIYTGSMICRLNISHSIMSAVIYIFMNIITVLTYHPASLIVIIQVLVLLTIVPVILFGAINVQQDAKQTYRATKLLERSMKESESLLLNILPVGIANRLKKTPGTIADGFNNVSVLFADIVGFTMLSTNYEPEVIVKMLNQIFNKFDNITKKYKAEKIKTIGDAYMLAAGIPEFSSKHSAVVANCALDMIKEANHFFGPDGNPIQIRVGLHTGPAIAGVIGNYKFSYDVWGDTVNIASRMESHGDAGKIQATMEIYEALKNEFVFKQRDDVEIKSKGKMKTFWLLDRKIF
jgi:class 3 adenylate cyclase